MHWGVYGTGNGASGCSGVSVCLTVGAGALEDHSSCGSSSSDMSGYNLVGLLEVTSCQIWVLCFFDCVLQWGNIASPKRSYADVKIMLFRDHISMWLCLFPIDFLSLEGNLNLVFVKIYEQGEEWCEMWVFRPKCTNHGHASELIIEYGNVER